MVAYTSYSPRLVVGGGVALLRANAALKNLKGANSEQDVGIVILRRALEEPLRQIVANAGDDSSVILNKVVEGKGNFGYNAATGEYGDMFEFGIIDPTKITRSALQNAASVAGNRCGAFLCKYGCCSYTSQQITMCSTVISCRFSVAEQLT